MDGIKDLKIIFEETGKRFAERFSSIPKLFIVFLLVNLADGLLNDFLIRFSIMTGTVLLYGVVRAFIEALVFSTMLYALSEVVRFSRLSITFDAFKKNFSRYFSDVYFVIFILWLGTWLFHFDMRSPIFLVAMLIFSALPETIYLTDASRGEAFIEALKFIKENYVFWIPLALVHVVLYYLFNQTLTLPFFIRLSPTQMIQHVIFLFVFAVYYTYRGVVFHYLYGSNPRKRKFMGAWK